MKTRVMGRYPFVLVFQHGERYGQVMSTRRGLDMHRLAMSVTVTKNATAMRPRTRAGRIIRERARIRFNGHCRCACKGKYEDGVMS